MPELTILDKFNNMKRLNPNITKETFCLLTGAKLSELNKEIRDQKVRQYDIPDFLREIVR